MGKRHSSRQDVCILTETGDIVDFRLETDSEEAYVASPDTLEAWELDFNQQCIDQKNGRYIQIISDRHKKPLKIFKNRPTLSGSTTDTISSRKEDEELAFLNSRKEKNKMVLWVGIIAALIAVVISIVVLVNMNKPADPAKHAYYLAPILAAMPAAAIDDTVNKNNKKKDKKKKKNNNHFQNKDELKDLMVTDQGLMQCIVIVEKTGERTFPSIAGSLIPADSLERKYRGKPCHLLNLSNEGELLAIEPDNQIILNESPKDCFIALEVEKEVNAMYTLREMLVEKIKIGVFIALCIVELIILFLIITAVSGGHP